MNSRAEVSVPLSTCSKVFVQRDYSRGLGVQFETTFPAPLEGKVCSFRFPIIISGAMCCCSAFWSSIFPCNPLRVPNLWENQLSTTRSMFATRITSCLLLRLPPDDGTIKSVAGCCLLLTNAFTEHGQGAPLNLLDGRMRRGILTKGNAS